MHLRNHVNCVLVTTVLFIHSSLVKRLNINRQKIINNAIVLVIVVTNQADSMEYSPWETNSCQTVQHLPAFCATRSFITVFTIACRLSLSWARWISQPHPFLFSDFTYRVVTIKINFETEIRNNIVLEQVEGRPCFPCRYRAILSCSIKRFVQYLHRCLSSNTTDLHNCLPKQVQSTVKL